MRASAAVKKTSHGKRRRNPWEAADQKPHLQNGRDLASARPHQSVRHDIGDELVVQPRRRERESRAFGRRDRRGESGIALRLNRIGKSNAANGRRRSRLPRHVIGERKRIPRNARRQRRRRGRIGIGRVAEKICAVVPSTLFVMRAAFDQLPAFTMRL